MERTQSAEPLGLRTSLFLSTLLYGYNHVFITCCYCTLSTSTPTYQSISKRRSEPCVKRSQSPHLALRGKQLESCFLQRFDIIITQTCKSDYIPGSQDRIESLDKLGPFGLNTRTARSTFIPKYKSQHIRKQSAKTVEVQLLLSSIPHSMYIAPAPRSSFAL